MNEEEIHAELIDSAIVAEKSDPFDVLAYIAFTFAPIAREKHVEPHKERIFSKNSVASHGYLMPLLGFRNTCIRKAAHD